MVLAAVARKIKVQKYFLGELVAKTSCNEVFLHSLCLFVSHQDQLLHAIEWHSQSLLFPITILYNALIP